MFGLWSKWTNVLGAVNFGLTLITTVDLLTETTTVVSVVTGEVWPLLRF